MANKNSYEIAEEIAKLVKVGPNMDPLGTYLKLFAVTIKQETLKEVAEVFKKYGKQAGI